MFWLFQLSPIYFLILGHANNIHRQYSLYFHKKPTPTAVSSFFPVKVSRSTVHGFSGLPHFWWWNPISTKTNPVEFLILLSTPSNAIYMACLEG